MIAPNTIEPRAGVCLPQAILIIDDAVDDPAAYRAAALALPFDDLLAGLAVFHGMALIGRSPVAARLRETLGLVTTWEAFRLSPAGQVEPNFVHSDRDMGQWSGILYLNPDPPEGDGTTFYRHTPTGQIASVAETPEALREEWLAWRDLTQWEPWHTVPAAFGRLCLFPSSYFHSRALVDNWGTGTDARLIQLLFGTGG